MLSLVFCLMLCSGDSDDPFLTAEQTWRAEREVRMKADTSWLSVVGLYWLKEGENSFGTGSACDLVFPTYTTVENAGSFFLEAGKVRYVMARSQRAKIGDKDIQAGPLESGQILMHNHLRIFLIERGGKIALRVRDLRAKNFVTFKALNFFEPVPEAVVEATFVPYETPKKLAIDTVINTSEEMLVPGELKFTLNGQELSLIPTLETLEDEEFFVVFKDKSAGDSTYGGGRFLYLPRPVDGKVTINFNRAFNPPCAYTDFATCPLPPLHNQLPIAILAGEKVYKNQHEEP